MHFFIDYTFPVRVAMIARLLKSSLLMHLTIFAGHVITACNSWQALKNLSLFCSIKYQTCFNLVIVKKIAACSSMHR